jgi:hypothetical protein
MGSGRHDEGTVAAACWPPEEGKGRVAAIPENRKGGRPAALRMKYVFCLSGFAVRGGIHGDALAALGSHSNFTTPLTREKIV